MIEKARDNMIIISKKLNDTDIAPLQSDFRFLTKVITAMSDILYEESQLRKKNNPEKLK